MIIYGLLQRANLLFVDHQDLISICYCSFNFNQEVVVTLGRVYLGSFMGVKTSLLADT